MHSDWFHVLQGNEYVEQTAASVADSEPNEIRRFEVLRSELIELEKRVQRSADQSENEEVNICIIEQLAFEISNILYFWKLEV